MRTQGAHGGSYTSENHVEVRSSFTQWPDVQKGAQWLGRDTSFPKNSNRENFLE